MDDPHGSWRHSGAPEPYLPAVVECRPDAWGRMSFFAEPLSFTGIDDANQSLASGMDLDVTNLDRLPMASPVPGNGKVGC
jgi:hypothetical protein